MFTRFIITLFLSLTLLSCGRVTFSEFSSLPSNVHWILSSGNPLMTLSDLQFPFFIETQSDGKIARSVRYNGAVNYNDEACAPLTDLIKKYNRTLVKYHDIVTGQAPDRITLEKILSVNEESDIGQFEYINSASLWFLSERTSADIDAQAKVPAGTTVLRGQMKAGTHISGSTLVAMTGAFKFTLDAPLARCLISGFETRALKNQFQTFRAQAASRGNRARAVVYTGAVVGSMISMQLRDAELAADANFDAGQAVGAKVKTEFSQSNLNITYEQHGGWREGFTLSKFLTELSQNQDPLAALGLMDRNASRYAVIGVVPVELDTQ